MSWYPSHPYDALDERAAVTAGYDLILSCWRPVIDRLLAASAAAAAPAAGGAAAAAPAPTSPAITVGAGRARDRPRIAYRFPDLPSAVPVIGPFDPATATVSAASAAAVVASPHPNPDLGGPAPGGRYTASLPAPAPEPSVSADADDDAASSLIWSRAATGRGALLASRVMNPVSGAARRASALAPAPQPLISADGDNNAASSLIWSRAAAGRAALLASRVVNAAAGFASRVNAPAPAQARQAPQESGSSGVAHARLAFAQAPAAGQARMLPVALARSAADLGALAATAEQPQLATGLESEEGELPSGHVWLSASG